MECKKKGEKKQRERERKGERKGKHFKHRNAAKRLKYTDEYAGNDVCRLVNSDFTNS